MPNFNDFINTLKDDLLDFAEENINEHKDELLKDGTAFAERAESDLKRWTVELADGLLTEEDFEFLVKGKKDLAEMEALKQLGLTKVRITELKDGIINIVVGSAIKTFL
jgi:hypothetical protein